VAVTAALTGHVAAVKWLCEHGCPLEELQLYVAAAIAGDVKILDYLVERGCELDADILTAMLNVAGASEQLAAAQWCRQRGAEWPARLVCDTPWEGDTLAWARAEGCTAPTTLQQDDDDDDLE
jgi:hypothetical protein